MKKIYAELARIQKELKAPKNLYNKFGNYAYRNAEGILEAVKPLLNGYVIVVHDDIILIGDRYYVKATATFTDGEEFISAYAHAREDETKKGMDGCQITGACSSYARKYALNALLMIDDSKDSDDDSLSPKNPDNMIKPVTGPVVVQPVLKADAPATVKVDAPAKVETVARVPSIPKEEPKVNPVQSFLLTAMASLRKQRNITAAENNKLFAAQHDALKKAGIAPNKELKEYNMDEAAALIDAMTKCFDLTGTELKTE